MTLPLLLVSLLARLGLLTRQRNGVRLGNTERTVVQAIRFGVQTPAFERLVSVLVATVRRHTRRFAR